VHNIAPLGRRKGVCYIYITTLPCPFLTTVRFRPEPKTRIYTMSPSASLVGIPFELRAMVIQLVLLAPQSDPPKPDELSKQQRRPLDATGYMGELARRVWFPSEPATNPALSLLLTNRQLYDETLDMLQRASKAITSPSYTADIIYLNDGTLWPTWLSTPFRASHADTVHVQFRIFQPPDDLRPGGQPPRRLFNGNSFMWSLYHLLLSALVSGSHGPCGIPISVDRLVLDFLPASQPDILPLGPVVSWEWISDPKELGERIFAKDIRENISDYFPLSTSLQALCGDNAGMEAAARLMRFVKKMLGWLVGLSDEMFEKGKVLFEHVGAIEICLDGRLHKVLDLGRYLANVSGWGGGVGSWRHQTWHNEFLPWRREVEARRRRLGMPVQASE